MIATTIEQSKRLLACGIKAETADMSYRVYTVWGLGDECPEYPELETTPFIHSEIEGSFPCASEEIKPAWSLSALLTGVLPHTIEQSRNAVCLEYDIDDKEGEHWICHYIYTNVSTWGVTPIEACVKMVELLHDEGLL